MTVQIVENSVTVPEDVDLTLDGHKVAVTGTNGKVERDFGHTKLSLDYQERVFRVWAENPRKKQAALVNTITSHVSNMIKGVTEGFTYRLKIVFIHFPMNFQFRGNKIVINNFVGEQKARIWFWLQVIRFIPDFIKGSIYWSLAMFQNYLKIVFYIL